MDLKVFTSKPNPGTKIQSLQLENKYSVLLIAADLLAKYCISLYDKTHKYNEEWQPIFALPKWLNFGKNNIVYGLFVAYIQHIDRAVSFHWRTATPQTIISDLIPGLENEYVRMNISQLSAINQLLLGIIHSTHINWQQYCSWQNTPLLGSV